ncbi:MAG: 50S ribosomal protein L17 [Elusimicrobiota bacterium]
MGLRPAHRKMMLRQLATNLVHYEKISTTHARAKELKVYTDRMIGSLKRNDNVVNRAREATRWLAPNGLDACKKLLSVILPRYAERKGGCVRVVALAPRKVDMAAIARVELVN